MSRRTRSKKLRKKSQSRSTSLQRRNQTNHLIRQPLVQMSKLMMNQMKLVLMSIRVMSNPVMKVKTEITRQRKKKTFQNQLTWIRDRVQLQNCAELTGAAARARSQSRRKRRHCGEWLHVVTDFSLPECISLPMKPSPKPGCTRLHSVVTILSMLASSWPMDPKRQQFHLLGRVSLAGNKQMVTYLWPFLVLL